MNFFDTWDVSRTPTPQPPNAQPTAGPSTQPEQEPTLNEEVNQVIGQLGRFWGGFRSQIPKVLETAKGGFGDVVVQAQKEFGKLSASAEPTDPNAPSSSSDEGKTDIDQTTRSPADPLASETPSGSSTNASNLFSRLQSALPPNLVTTVQSHIPESIKHASENVDLAQIRTNLLTEFQRVQGITRAQAEEYAHKGEAYLREVVKEANEVLKDAVKIIPPEEAAAQADEGSGLVWDGTDMWMLPTVEVVGKEGSAAAAEGSSKQTGETQTAAVASRALALLHRLQSDPSIINHDPEADESGKDQYRQWLTEEVEAKGGIEGEEWKGKSDALLKENTTFYEMYTSLVPDELSKETFWSRYHFRAHQITVEEERRKALIQATTESDEDFSWEGSDSEEEEEEEEDDDDDDDDETSSDASTSAPAAKGKQPDQKLAPPAAEPSTRANSQDSFDVVSSTSASGTGTGDKKAPKPADSESDDDSDWE